MWAPECVDNALAETRIRLALVALGGVMLAGAPGPWSSGRANAVRRLTNREMSLTRDLSHCHSEASHDELGRLAASLNVMLAEFETRFIATPMVATHRRAWKRYGCDESRLTSGTADGSVRTAAGARKSSWSDGALSTLVSDLRHSA